MMRRMDVHEAANRRLKIIFDYFDYVYVSFSGGKDSGILLHLCMDYIRMHAPGRKLGVFIAFAIFLFIRLLSNLRRKKEETPLPPPVPSNEEKLLSEIRDLLKKQ